MQVSDDVLVALVLTLTMLRRLETKTASSEQNPHVPVEAFEQWQRLALRVHNQVALASILKIAFNQIWLRLGLGHVPEPAFQIVAGAAFAAWLFVLIAAWKRATDAREMRYKLQIVTRREAGRRRVAPRSAPSLDAAPPAERAEAGH